MEAQPIAQEQIPVIQLADVPVIAVPPVIAPPAPVVAAAPSKIVVHRKRTRLSYAKLCERAIKNLTSNQDGKKTASYQAICKYIANHWTVPDTFKRHVSRALKQLLAQKKLSPFRRSYKLAVKTEKRKVAVAKKEEDNKRKRANVVAKKRGQAIDAPMDVEVKVPKPKEAPPKKPIANNNDAPKNARVHKADKEAKSVKEVAPMPKSSLKTKYDHVWQYYHNGWQNYDIVASDTVEQVYLNYLSNRGDNDVRAVKSGQWEYQVDFMAMKQTNIQHPSHTVRDIRRVALSA